MALAVIDEQNLHDIADAIRAKNGTQDTYTPGEMATAVSSLPSGTNYLEKLCRRELTKLTPTELGESKYISNYMFYNDTYIKELWLPTTMKSMGSYAFAYSQLQKLRIDCPSLTSLASYCFQEAPITDLYIDAPMLATGGSAFYLNHSIVHPVLVSIKNLDNSMFYDDYKIEDIDIPETCILVNYSALAIASGRSLSSYSNLYTTFKRHAIVSGTSITQATTEVKSNSFSYRDANKLFLFVPFDSICGYRFRFKNVSDTYLSRCFTYIDAQDGDTLPTSTSQQYGTRDGSYTVEWYTDRDMTQPAPASIMEGRYYGVITVVSENIQ